MKNLISLVMVLAVSVVIIGGTLAPYIDGVTAETKTYVNEGMPYAAVDSDDHTIEVTADSITVDGDSVDTSLFSSGFTSHTILFSESGEFVRLDYSSDEVRVVLSAALPTQYSMTNNETITIAVSGSTATVSSSDTSKATKTISDVTYYVSTEGDYVLSANPCVSNESVICGAGQTNFNNSQGVASYTFTYAAWSGTLDDLSGTVLYVSALTGSAVTYEVANSSISSVIATTTDADGSDLVRVDSVAVNYALIGSDSETYTPTATYTYFLAPAEVVYDNPDYLGASNAALVGVMVLLAIAALLVVTVRYVSREY